jgi:hypothetical protein
MEAPGFLTLLYIMLTLPKEQGIAELPWGNWTMAGLFVRIPHSSLSQRTPAFVDKKYY